MIERTNRRDQIVEVAARLFVEQGYASTSVRQIAEEVGCTEAALYYHFKEGKRALLQAVLAYNLPDLAHVIENLSEPTSLRDLVTRFSHEMSLVAQRVMGDKISWITREFPTFGPEERQLVYAKHLEFRKQLVGYIRPFMSSDEEAESFAWILIFVAFGYGQLMLVLDLQSALDFDIDIFITYFAAQLANGR